MADCSDETPFLDELTSLQLLLLLLELELERETEKELELAGSCKPCSRLAVELCCLEL
jgi:hypothetical protein